MKVNVNDKVLLKSKSIGCSFSVIKRHLEGVKWSGTHVERIKQQPYAYEDGYLIGYVKEVNKTFIVVSYDRSMKHSGDFYTYEDIYVKPPKILDDELFEI